MCYEGLCSLVLEYEGLQEIDGLSDTLLGLTGLTHLYLGKSSVVAASSCQCPDVHTSRPPAVGASKEAVLRCRLLQCPGRETDGFGVPDADSTEMSPLVERSCHDWERIQLSF